MVVDPNDEEELVPAEGTAKFFHKNMRKKMHGVLRDVKHMAQTASAKTYDTDRPTGGECTTETTSAAWTIARHRNFHVDYGGELCSPSAWMGGRGAVDIAQLQSSGPR